MLKSLAVTLSDNSSESPPDSNVSVRFEDLTIDDDLSLLDRVIRYVKSSIALQRLVHVKMISETGFSVGTTLTIQKLIPLLPSLVTDAESIIRRHLATQLLPLCLTCMFGDEKDFDPNNKNRNYKYDEVGYKVVTVTMLNHISTLILDPDVDVRKAASDGLATLALYIKAEDIVPMILNIPLKLIHNDRTDTRSLPEVKVEKNDGKYEDMCITAATLLGDIASLDSRKISSAIVSHYITPTIISMCQDRSFRVRRASVQALPRIVSGSTANDVCQNLLPCYISLSEDDMYRVRKSVGECLVDMSRSLTLLAATGSNISTHSSGKQLLQLNDINSFDGEKSRNEYREITKEELKGTLLDLRRNILIPICSHLLSDSNKIVRHGMMQFLGPFIASFYPLGGTEEINSIINQLSSMERERVVGGIGLQFFPHANGMVNRLDSSTLSTIFPLGSSSETTTVYLDNDEYIQSHLPVFLHKAHNDSQSMIQIMHHRNIHPPSTHDIAAVTQILLEPYVNLATISTGDENIDAEMRVYCAYSLPAVILLLGKDGWRDALRDCFFALITGSKSDSPVPIPVKRCLASSFHTICHTLGFHSLQFYDDEQSKERKLFSIFESHFLRDSDNTVKLNVIRNLPSLFSTLTDSRRSMYLPVLSEIITGEAMLGASRRRSASNPALLNWRQRDMVAQILPNLIMLYKPEKVRTYLWPIILVLMSDSVSVVCENVEWSIPIIFRIYETKNCGKDNEKFERNLESLSDASKFSAECCGEVLSYLKTTLLKSVPNISSGKIINGTSFSRRQGYCRILTAVALLLRVGSSDRQKRRNRRSKNLESSQPPRPFHNLTLNEYRHIHHVLQNYLLPPALEMKNDRVTNVRLSLLKSLRLMPNDIRENNDVKTILQTLEDEVHTWEDTVGIVFDKTDADSQKCSLYQNPLYTSQIQTHEENEIDVNFFKHNEQNRRSSYSSSENSQINYNISTYDKSNISKRVISRKGTNVIINDRMSNRQSTLRNITIIPNENM